MGSTLWYLEIESKGVEIGKDEVSIEYTNISTYGALRIIQALSILDDEGLIPAIYEINYDRSKIKNTFDSSDSDEEVATGGFLEIVQEKVIPLSDVIKEEKRPPKAEVIKKVTQLVETLHYLGYAHGDLHLGNLGYREGRYYLLDYDTIYWIQEKPEWVIEWMEEQFDIENYGQFVQYDFTNWIPDLDEYYES